MIYAQSYQNILKFVDSFSMDVLKLLPSVRSVELWYRWWRWFVWIWYEM